VRPSARIRPKEANPNVTAGNYRTISILNFGVGV
jgi:hypothetical protein